MNFQIFCIMLEIFAGALIVLSAIMWIGGFLADHKNVQRRKMCACLCLVGLGIILVLGIMGNFRAIPLFRH